MPTNKNSKRNVRKIYVKRKKQYKPRVQKSLALQTHTFCERLKNVQIDLNTTQLDVNGHLTITNGQSFSFAMLPQVSSYSKLFYQFRILKIIAEISWAGTGTSAPVQTVTPVAPGLPYFIPLNDTSAPVLLVNRNHTGINLTYAEMDSSCKTKRLRLNTGKTHVISLKPSCQDQMQGVGTTTVNVPQYNQWFISDQVNAQTVPHYGLNYQVDTYNAGTGTNMGSVLIKYKMYFQCKGNE